MSNESSPTSGQLTIWCNVPLPAPVFAEIRRSLAPHRFVVPPTQAASAPSTTASGATLAMVDVAFGQPDPRQVIESPRLRWVHLNTAGYTTFDTAEMRGALAARGGILTNSSSVYDEPCAQHVLAMMLAQARQLPLAWADQHSQRGWPQAALRAGARLLDGQTAVLFGYGAIARRLTELLSPMRMNLIGVRRTPRGDEPITVVSTHAADEWLSWADHVVNLLPAAAGNEEYFDAPRIESMKQGAVFYNIGRGSTVDQAALVAALRTGRLAAAYLDVTSPEPLPPNHLLWSAPNCHITPHMAGGHADEPDRVAQLFLENLRRFTSGEPLSDRVF